MKREGFDIDVARHGNEALEYLRNRPTHLVITDIYMPEMDGFELIGKIHSEFGDLKIIAISGGGVLHAKEITLRLASDLGLDAYFEKPFTTKELVAKINELIPADKSAQENAKEG